MARREREEHEFYNQEFPNTVHDFVYLTRPLTPAEIGRADKDGLIALCTALKQKELEYYIERNNCMNLLERIFQEGVIEGKNINNQKDIMEDLTKMFTGE